MINFGEVPAGSVLPIPFDSFNSAGASVTLTGLAVTDIEVYKGTSMTQRSSDNGYALMDTDGIDLDGVTGIHGFSIDTGDNTDAGFYSVGSFFWVVVSSVTIDGQTVTFIAATFRIRAAEATAGYPVATLKVGTGTGEVNLSSGRAPADVTHWNGGAVPATAVTGTPLVDINLLRSNSAAADNFRRYMDGLVAGTADSGTTTTMVDAALTQADTNYFKGSKILFTSGNIAGQSRLITAFTPGTDTLTFSPALTQAVSTQNYIILPDARSDLELWQGSTPNALQSNQVPAYVSQMATAVLTATAIASDAFTAAKFASDVGAEFADAVWDEDATGHQTQGTFGQAIGDPGADTDTIWALVNTNLNATVSSRASQTSVDTIDDFLDTEVAAILADTNELQTDWTNGGRLDLLVDAIKAKTDNLPTDPADASVIAGRFDTLDTAVADLPTNAELATALAAADDAVLAAIAALNNLSAAQVNAEIVDALATDSYGEPAQATPPESASLSYKISMLYKALINLHDQTATLFQLYNYAGDTVDQKAPVAVAGGTFTRSPMETGP